MLLLANDAGVFDLLRKPVSTETVATEKGWDTRGTGLFLDTLVALGYADRKAGHYKNTTIATRHLCCDSPEPLTAFLRHTGHCKRRWDRLERTGGRPTKRDRRKLHAEFGEGGWSAGDGD